MRHTATLILLFGMLTFGIVTHNELETLKDTVETQQASLETLQSDLQNHAEFLETVRVVLIKHVGYFEQVFEFIDNMLI